MEYGKYNHISPDVIEALIAANPDHPDEVFDAVHLVQQGEIGPDSLEPLIELESEKQLTTIIQIGKTADKGAGVDLSKAA